MTIFSALAAAAFAAMLLTQAAGPAFASLDPLANGGATAIAATTTGKTARLPATAVDLACKGQAWGAESQDCLRAIAEQSGAEQSRAVRMIASSDAPATTPNVF